MKEILQIVDDSFGDLPANMQPAARNMRGDDRSRYFAQWVPHGQRLRWISYVQSAAKALPPDFCGQSLKINQATSRDVNDHGAVGQQCQRFGIEQATSLVGKCGSQD